MTETDKLIFINRFNFGSFIKKTNGTIIRFFEAVVGKTFLLVNTKFSAEFLRKPQGLNAKIPASRTCLTCLT